MIVVDDDADEYYDCDDDDNDGGGGGGGDADDDGWWMMDEWWMMNHSMDICIYIYNSAPICRTVINIQKTSKNMIDLDLYYKQGTI